MGIEPAGDVESLRGEHWHVGPTTLHANQEVVLEQIRGKAIEIVAEIDTNGAPMVELKVLRSPGQEEYTRIAFYRQRGYRDWERYAGWERGKRQNARDSLLTIDSSYSSQHPDVQSRAPETGPVFLAVTKGGEVIAGKAISPSSAWRRVRYLGEKAGLGRRVHPHLFRHGACTTALDLGVALHLVQDFLRHSDPRTTRRYDSHRLSLANPAPHVLASVFGSAEA